MTISNEHPDMSGNPMDEPFVCEICGKHVREDRIFGSLKNTTVILCSAECVFDYDDDAHQSDEPIHEWFGLAYSSYLVIPISVLQSAPVWWQRQFVALVEQLGEAVGEIPDNYMVQMRDEKNRTVRDEYADYDRGRRRIPLKPMPEPTP